ncbi:substrate-binding domain-containing protein [Streptomyces sp. NBC_01465]|uniref:substrate-binding domain-containing protein n=1 Tax=Streptomyces sp. NBC_01465 TaxID=2903878 RepID=UPI002E2F3042|nr:substrate-binding domain-containing protein [Streptomyces sp. NBC_01465]
MAQADRPGLSGKGGGRGRTGVNQEANVTDKGEGENPAAPGDTLSSITIACMTDPADLPAPTPAPQPPTPTPSDDHHALPERTRACVEELLRHHGADQPGDNSELVELVFHELTNMWSEEILHGIEAVAREQRVGLVVSGFAARSGELLPLRAGAPCLSVRPLPAWALERLTARGIPFVVYDPITELSQGTPYVGSTNFRGGQAATRHLLGLGHRRIAMINGPDHPYCVARQAGHLAALAEAGLSPEPGLTPQTPITFEDGHATARQLLSLPDPPTAIFAASDMQALGVYQAARELGLSIPGDLSVVGFDDLPVAALLDPPLTTVYQPLREMAATAAGLALALGRGGELPQTGVEIATALVVRQSTAPPRQHGGTTNGAA